MRIAVVGGGLSGLTCGYRLKMQGHEVVVYESEPHVGGRMASVKAGGFTIDIGASLLLENYRHTQALARELGIADQWFAFHARDTGGILRNGRVTSFTPDSARAILSYKGISFRSRLRFLAYLVRARFWVGKLDFFDLSSGDDGLENVEAESYARKHFGDELFDWLFDPFVRTFHFHGARRISMKYFDALAALVVGQRGFASHGFRRNMGALTHALAGRLEAHRGCGVSAVASNSSGVIVEYEHSAGTRSAQFDACVLATPATVARSIFKNPEPAEAALLAAVEYASTIMCAFRVPVEVAGDFEGMWIPYAESRMICCCANETRKGSSDASECLIILGLHEEAAGALLSRADDEIYEAVSREWCRLFPAYQGHMKGIHAHRWRDAIPVYAPGLIARVANYWQNGQGARNIWLCGDYLNHPWVEGSIHCGEKIAERIGAACR